jgi:nuclear pore complex protein Nup205
MAASFVPSHFEKLHRILKDSIASPARVASSNDWYIAIDRSRAELVDIAKAKRPSEAEKREIQSGQSFSLPIVERSADFYTSI